MIVRSTSNLRIILSASAGAGALLAIILVAQHLFLATYPLATSMVVIFFTGLTCLGRQLLRAFRKQRTIDEETGLPNSRALQATRHESANAITMVADITNFDGIHAVLGVQATASLVSRVAERLALVGEDGRVFRVADRQLALRASSATLDDDALEGLRVVMLQPIEVSGRRIDVNITVGLASGCDDQALADAALAAGEAFAADKFWHHATADLASIELSMSLMGELDEALTNGAIDIFYQPKLHLRENSISSVEALVRWRHPDRGLIGPDTFIPMAESTNRIAPLTLYVLERVMRDVTDWQGVLPGVGAAINISAKLLSSAVFNAAVEHLLDQVDVSPEHLIFEVTESVAMLDPNAAIAALHRYRALGVAISMDDYGTGQSTLTYLRQLPLSELKIDRSFIQHVHVNDADAKLVRSTIDLAHELGLKVVAEGVEHQEGMTFLRSCKCDLVQGYLVSRPVPRDQLIAEWSSPGARAGALQE